MFNPDQWKLVCRYDWRGGLWRGPYLRWRGFQPKKSRRAHRGWATGGELGE
jgi:hypothetical protein